MTEVKVPPFKCLFCDYQFSNVTVEIEKIKELYHKTTKPVPVPLKCPNGHNIIIFLYTQGNEVRIRSIMPAAELDADEKKKFTPLNWFEKW
ncbi:MAG: hypothetical protein ACP6IS_01075 [Candidatus Asgardarchaeia archaeon]